jgi:peroxiredoxin
VSDEPEQVIQDFADTLGLSLPILMDEGHVVTEAFHRESAFPTAAFPHEYVIGVDGTIVYYNNRFEYDQVVEVLEAELAKME